ncbi:hypothetical protein E8E11_000629 [Didymella keratinophila]|nr:hypothetical protein E8E11_000629 [Didymella keratinophila]
MDLSRYPTSSSNIEIPSRGATQQTLTMDTDSEDHSAVYEPINYGCAEMRLLEIKPGDYDDDLEMELKTVHLPDDPRYMALSYVWGHDISPRPCIVGGVPVFIKQNLDDALRHFRKHHPFSSLWVDALCINQADLDERASQVGMMFYIYRLADGIFAWLGRPKDEGRVRAGMTLMQSLRDYMTADHRTRVVDYKQPYWAQISGVLQFMPREQDTDLWYAWEGVSEVFACAYWNRLWIQQEATTPKPIRFWLGDYSLDDGPYATAVDWLGTFSRDPRFPLEFRRTCGYDSGVGPVIAARIARQEDGSRQFTQLLQEMRTNGYTNPLDKVFAPFGLASDAPKDLIKVDYRAKIVDVYVNVAQVLILEMPVSLKALGLVCIPTTESSHTALKTIWDPRPPTWVPDWRQSVSQPAFSSINSIRDRDTPLYHPFPGAVDVNVYRNRLSVLGIVARDVHILSDDLYPLWDCQDGCHIEPWGWWKVCTERYADDTELDLAVRRSLVGDRCLIEQPSIENGLMRIWGRGGAIDWKLFDRPSEQRDEAAAAQVLEQHMMMKLACYTRRMALLSNHRVAIMPAAAEVGDRVAAFRGGHSLYLLRPLDDRSEYQFVGECYVDGWMDGQLVAESREEPEIIVLI